MLYSIKGGWVSLFSAVSGVSCPGDGTNRPQRSVPVISSGIGMSPGLSQQPAASFAVALGDRLAYSAGRREGQDGATRRPGAERVV